VWASRTQLQGAADAAASAATQAQRDTGSPGPARAAAIGIAVLHDAGGESVQLDGADAEFNESLARGFGVGFTTTDEEDLDELLSLILARMPVYLVK
jgi:hypothetical protein